MQAFVRSYEVTIDEVVTGAAATVVAGAVDPKLNEGTAVVVVAGAVVAAVRVVADLEASAVEVGAPKQKPALKKRIYDIHFIDKMNKIMITSR
jgi:hypothetical protein